MCECVWVARARVPAHELERQKGRESEGAAKFPSSLDEGLSVRSLNDPRAVAGARLRGRCFGVTRATQKTSVYVRACVRACVRGSTARGSWMINAAFSIRLKGGREMRTRGQEK